MRVDHYSHHFVVTPTQREEKKTITNFCMLFGQQGPVRVAPGRFRYQIVRVFAASTIDKEYFRFLNGLEDDFIEYMKKKDYPPTCFEHHYHDVPEPDRVDFKLKDWLKPRDYQQSIVDTMVSEGKTYLLPLQTGYGKTGCFLMAADRIGERACMVIKPMYIKKWKDDVMGACDIAKKDLMVVQGTEALVSYMNLALAGEITAKFIIFSNTTLSIYFKYLRENNGNLGPYPLEPTELFTAAGIGIRGIDEVHQDYHMNWVLESYTHVKKTISLSATLEHDDPLMEKLYRIMFPAHTRVPVPEWEKYIVAKALIYGMKNPHAMKYTNNALKSYSHIKLEKSILKKKTVLKGYLKMIGDSIDISYAGRREEGHKALIFASLVDMCDELVDYLKTRFSNLDIRRYTSDDDYENIKEADIAVSTIKSAGTAIDIPGLITVLMSDSVDSKQANIQALGRLRKPKGDVDVEFLYLVCRDIAKQVTYHERKKEKFKGRVLSHMTYHIPYNI